MRCFLLILIITFCINCNNHKTDNKKNGVLLSKTEAEELKDKLYKEYSLNLIVNKLKEIEDGIIPEIVVFFLAPKRTMEAILTMIVKYKSDQMPLIWLQRGAESDEIVEMLESNNIKHVKDDCIVEYITGNKMNKVPKCENQPWFRQISDEDGSGCSVWQAFKPLETGSNFTTELEWAGDLEDLAKSQHTIARYIRSLAKPDETLFETAIRLS